MTGGKFAFEEKFRSELESELTDWKVLISKAPMDDAVIGAAHFR